jgi:hypothetical protein
MPLSQGVARKKCYSPPTLMWLHGDMPMIRLTRLLPGQTVIQRYRQPRVYTHSEHMNAARIHPFSGGDVKGISRRTVTRPIDPTHVCTSHMVVMVYGVLTTVFWISQLRDMSPDNPQAMHLPPETVLTSTAISCQVATMCVEARTEVQHTSTVHLHKEHLHSDPGQAARYGQGRSWAP